MKYKANIYNNSHCEEPEGRRSNLFKLANMKRLLRHFAFAPLLAMTVTLTPILSLADSSTNLLFKANEAYQEGNFSEAKELYYQAIEKGHNNGHILYNLANANYRLNEIGYAIANYQKALLELPRDPDIKANLSLARKKAIDKIDIQDPLINLPFSKYEQTLVTVLCICFFLVIFALEGLYKNTLVKTLKYITLCTSLCLGGLLLYQKYAFQTQPAVILSKEAHVYSGNSETFQVVFVLHSGAEVEVREVRNNWLEILLPKGRQGWVKKQDIELING